MLTFFAELFQISQEELLSSNDENEDLTEELSTEGEDVQEIRQGENEDKHCHHNKRKTQLFCLFQTMFYVM